VRVLFLGDVVGRHARQLVMDSLPGLRQELSTDFIIVNVENAAGGFGITPDIADGFLAAGADVMTTGNHVWDKREIFAYIDQQPRLIRPTNMPEGTPGQGMTTVTNAKGQSLTVINAMTNLFMAPTEPMLPAIKACLAKTKLKRDTDAIVIDVHGEATSEKTATGFYVDGLVSMVVGTHTHVPTADHRILPSGTAFMTDAGMCGDYTSVIGMTPEAAIGRFTGDDKSKLGVAMGAPSLSGVFVVTDDDTGLAKSISPFRRGGTLAAIDPVPLTS